MLQDHGRLHERRDVLAVFPTAGFLGPLIFTAGFLVQPLFRRGEYDPTVEAISDLEAGPGGWVQQLNFVVFGLLIIAFAVGLHRGVARARASVVGPAILGANGAGLVIAGVFLMREDAAGLTYDPLGVHSVNGAIFFLTIGIGLITLSRRLSADPSWRRLAGYVLTTGITLVIGFVALVVFVRPTGAPLHSWFGLGQRVVLTLWMLCILVLAVRLRTLAARTNSDHPRVVERQASVADTRPADTP